MKKKDGQNEKLMFEIAQENKRLSEPLQKVLCPPSQLLSLIPAVSASAVQCDIRQLSKTNSAASIKLYCDTTAGQLQSSGQTAVAFMAHHNKTSCLCCATHRPKAAHTSTCLYSGASATGNATSGKLETEQAAATTCL